MKRYYVILGALVLAGIGGSILLIPDREEIALMHLKDKRFEVAKQTYEDELKKGKDDVSVISPLVDLMLQEGKVDKAIELTEKYVAEHPGNVEALKRLGRYYQYAQRQDDYLRTLEEVRKHSPSTEVLKNLSDIYNSRVQYEKQTEVLREMLKHPNSRKPEAYVDLANLLAVQKRYEEASQVLLQLHKDFPDAFTNEQLELTVSLLMDQNKPDEALNLAKEQLNKKTDLQKLAEVASILHYRGASAHAIQLVTPYEKEALGNTQLFDLVIELYIRQGKSDDAYKMLQDLYRQNKLPPTTYGTLMDLAMEYNNTTLAAELAKKLSPASITENTAVQLLLTAKFNSHHELYNLLLAKLNTPEALEDRPYLQAIVALLTRQPNAEILLAEWENTSTKSTKQHLEIGEACVRSGYDACTIRQIEVLKEIEPLTEITVNGISRLYLYSGRYNEGYEYINLVRQLNPEAKLENAWLLLAAATGKKYEIEKWLDATPKPSMAQLRDLYYISNDNKRTALTLLLAQAMHEQAPTPETEHLLALARLQAGHYAEVLPHFRKLKTDNRENREAYLLALSHVAKNNKAAHKELLEFVSTRLKSGKVDETEKQELVYTLINANTYEPIMPYLETYALAHGGSWAALYQEQLIRQGRTEQLRLFLTKLGEKSFVSETEKRAIAFSLLDRGYKAEAMSVFEKLAAKAPPKSDNVTTLMFMWGPRPTAQQLDWLRNRAIDSNTQEEGLAWLRLLAEHGGQHQLVSLLQDRRHWLKNQDVAVLYVEALAETDGAQLRKEVAILTLDHNKPDVLRRFADAARDRYETRTARTIYDKLLRAKPDDPEALLQVGIISYSLADYKTARVYLERFQHVRQNQKVTLVDSYQAPYYLAEMLVRERKNQQAVPYYRATLDELDLRLPKTVEMQAIAARSQFYAGDEKAGLENFRSLVEAHPNDAMLRADYVSLLVDNGMHEEAQSVINMAAAAGNAEEPVSSQTVASFRAEDIVRYSEGPRPYEVMLVTRPNAEEIARRNGVNTVRPAGLQYISTGYDTLLLGGTDATILHVESADGQTRVVALPAPRQIDPKLEEQLTLRTELLQARIELETGREEAALDRLNRLQKSYPQDAQLLGYTANAENAAGNWRRATALIEQAKQISPENEDIRILERDIVREHGPRVTADAEWRQQGKHDEKIASVSGFAYVQPYLEVGFRYLTNLLDAKTIRRSDGRIGSFDATRHQAEIYTAYTYESGARSRASLYANNDTLGAGIEYAFIHRLGLTTLEADYHKPYWEYVEGTLDNATRDRLGINHQARLTQDLTLESVVGYHRYNVEEGNDLASAIAVNLALLQRLAETTDYYLGISYGFDGEYLVDDVKRLDSDGELYRPFPLVSREVHSLNLLGRYHFTERLIAEGLLGYGYDRLGGHGPSVEGRLSYLMTEALEAQIRASHNHGFGNVDDNIDRIGGYLQWKFAP